MTTKKILEGRAFTLVYVLVICLTVYATTKLVCNTYLNVNGAHLEAQEIPCLERNGEKICVKFGK